MRTPNTVVRFDLSAAWSALARACSVLHAVGAEGLRQLLPVDAAELHAVRRDALDLLLDANEADLRRLQLGHRHQEAPRFAT
jgi:hypothetical protein